ncbi:hypothetical protein ACE939_04455 [Aquimarina sp. W85]|uniref:hypothetical protein n=1 Tax=Aquimarina rhodophyticola TaxID=3342246 RepID=UPI003672F90B
MEHLENLCNSPKDSILEILSYLNSSEKLKPLQTQYRYCKNLDGSYQRFTANFQEKTKEITQRRDLIYLNEKQNPENYDLDSEIKQLQYSLLEDFTLWVKAFNISKTYRKCFENKDILTFSHRIDGWSNPEYKLNKNFSIELKTNFGYGSSSYFYIKLKYKNIDITPVSEWINYELAKFSEIVRYTKSFSYKSYRGIYNGRRIFRKEIQNSYWQNAMEFAKEACNCSLRSETEFIQKYVIEECENMVVGLTDIMTKSTFTFIGEGEKHYSVDKKGHRLIEFRGEKVSGAIDFISKIVEYNQITEIQNFITKIEEINKEIQPILISEIEIIAKKLFNLNSELEKLKPEYEHLKSRNKEYETDIGKLRIEMINNKVFEYNSVDLEKLMKQFNQLNPEYSDFKDEYELISQQYSTLVQKIDILKKLKVNIVSYQVKIKNYFAK